MNSVSELAEAARKLSLAEQRELIARLEVEIREREMPPRTEPRIMGLHRGMVWMAEDFNDPLPDEFWLGEEDFGGKKTPSADGPRISGLGKGMWHVSDDFDGPILDGSGNKKKP